MGAEYLGEIFVSLFLFSTAVHDRHDKSFFIYVKVVCIRDKVIPVSVRLSEFNCVFPTISV